MDLFAADYGLPHGHDWAPDELLAHEREVRLASLDERVGVQIGNVLLDRALAESLPVAFEVWVRGRLVFRAALPGSNEENDEVIRGKLAFLGREAHASLWGSRTYRDRLASEPSLKDERDLSGPYGGAFPLRTRDAEDVQGAVVLSGLSEQDDHAAVMWAVRQVIDRG